MEFENPQPYVILKKCIAVIVNLKINKEVVRNTKLTAGSVKWDSSLLAKGEELSWLWQKHIHSCQIRIWLEEVNSSFTLPWTVSCPSGAVRIWSCCKHLLQNFALPRWAACWSETDGADKASSFRLSQERDECRGSKLKFWPTVTIRSQRDQKVMVDRNCSDIHKGIQKTQLPVQLQCVPLSFTSPLPAMPEW